jgi:hypothetical protein
MQFFKLESLNLGFISLSNFFICFPIMKIIIFLYMVFEVNSTIFEKWVELFLGNPLLSE